MKFILSLISANAVTNFLPYKKETVSHSPNRLIDLRGEVTISRLSEAIFEVSFGAENGVGRPMTILKADLWPNENNVVTLINATDAQIQVLSDIVLVKREIFKENDSDGRETYVYTFADGVKLKSHRPLSIVENEK